MHETIIAANIIKEAKKLGDIKSVNVEVGELGHLPAKELEMTLRTLTKWNIVVKEKKATVRCKCGYNGRPKILERGHDMCLFVCPKCEKVPEILEGNQIKILSVETK